jgi:hypothetical protein
MKHKGSCHCGAVSFEFEGPEITSGLRCNCSICRRKGALMTEFLVAPSDIDIADPENVLATYDFGSKVAKHHFCSRCGIYTFHQTVRKPGYYRANIGCLEGVDSNDLPFDVFDGASL